jgi:hypothetical protein
VKIVSRFQKLINLCSYQSQNLEDSCRNNHRPHDILNASINVCSRILQQEDFIKIKFQFIYSFNNNHFYMIFELRKLCGGNKFRSQDILNTRFCVVALSQKTKSVGHFDETLLLFHRFTIIFFIL